MMLYHKLFEVLFLPVGLSLLFIIAGVVMGRRLLIGFGAMVLWIFSMPVVGDFMMVAAEGFTEKVPVASVQSAEAIVVLGGGHKFDRFDGGLELFKAKRAPVIVFTRGYFSGSKPGVSQGELFSKRAVLEGVPSSSIRLTGTVVNTADEARATGELLGVDKMARKKIILVTSAVHMRRAALLFQRAGFDVERYPVDFRRIGTNELPLLNYLPDAEYLLQSSIALREFYGWFYYRIQG